mmetsp:Transcript_25068/g.47486  ORF Transcript_25068/g.47486 Transcript_25068/m.47486 type:complete len:238 (-) Transcript_25068:2-715(-)
MSIQSGAEQLRLSHRVADLERQVQRLTEESEEKVYIKAAVALIDGRVTGLEIAQKSLVLEVDGCAAAMETTKMLDASRADGRIMALETSLQDLGAHFVRYQEDLVAILAKKFKSQEDRIQAFAQEAMARTRDQMMGELDSTSDSTQLLCSNGGTMSNWDMSIPETASTTASEDSEKQGDQGELEKLIFDARKEIDLIYSDLRAHVVSTEKRLSALEMDSVITNATSKETRNKKLILK